MLLYCHINIIIDVFILIVATNELVKYPILTYT